jgi:hypothetical protein
VPVRQCELGAKETDRTVCRRTAAGEIKEGFGNMPVDSENKACELRPWSFSFPHMVSFHCSWLGFFTTFVSTFAAAPMVRASADVLCWWRGLYCVSVAQLACAAYSPGRQGCVWGGYNDDVRLRRCLLTRLCADSYCA